MNSFILDINLRELNGLQFPIYKHSNNSLADEQLYKRY